MDEQVLPRELHALLNSLILWDSWECSIWNNAEFAFLTPLTLLISLTHLVVKQQIQEVIHTLSIGSHFDS